MALLEMNTLSLGTVMARNVVYILCWFSLLECVQGLMNIVEEHRQAFIQTNRELRYLVDGISLHLQEGLLGNADEFASWSGMENVNTYTNLLTFYPPSLDFREHPIGMPQQHRVLVSNPSYHINVFLLSISGSSVHFHCSFFQDKVIPPGGNTTFEIIFLARHEGSVRSTLYIHTSVGTFDYQVQGSGLPNPYRLRPFIGARVPLNSVFSPMIKMYNPHNFTLQVLEMYSSGGDLHLELTNGEREASKDHWKILPYETKPVMQASFLARVESNHTVYICIKTNHSEIVELVLPFEVEVTSAPGIYSMTDSLDFGVIYEKDASRTLALSLVSHKLKQVHISTIDVIPLNRALTVDFHPVKIQPDTCPTTVATITFHPSKVTDSSQMSGNLVIRTRTKEHKLVLPYHALILRGSLHFNVSATLFYVGGSRTSDMLHQPLVLQNTFPVGIAILSADLPPQASVHFRIQLERGMVLLPNETKAVGTIALIDNSTNVKMTTHVRLTTNISQFELPLICYDGKLTQYVALPWNSSKLDIGTLSFGENKNVVFAVLNDNPINVTVRRFGATLPHLVLELLTIGSGNVTDALVKQHFVGVSKSMVLQPTQYSIFRIGVMAPNVEGTFQGSVFVETQFEDLRIPFTFKTANGFLAVIPPSLTFEPSFPGKVATSYLYIQSTFSQPMTVTSVTTTATDTRISYQPPKGSLPVLQPNANTYVGKLHFDVQRVCGNKCYSGFDVTNKEGYKWLLGMKLLHNVVSTDVAMCQRLWSSWTEIVESQKTCINITLLVNTNEVHGLLVHAHAFLMWPSLTTKTSLKFPLTQIGNISLREVLLENPSSKPIIAQLVALNMYPDLKPILVALKDRGLPFSPLSRFSSGRNTFRIHNPICTKARVLTDVLGVVPHQDTLVLLIEPGGKVVVPVHFIPSDEKEQLSLLLIRNNLTAVEAVELEGTGSHGQLAFGSLGANTDSYILHFKLTEKHLQNCDTGSAAMHYSSPVFTARRVLPIYNTGKLPVYINGFDIDGIPCMGYGFGVLGCQPFVLPPNSSEKLDVVFTPDFTLARVLRHLNVHTSLSAGGQVPNVTLVAALPPHLLANCAAALPRPHWEALVYYLSISVMCFLFFCVMIAGYLEYDRIIRCRCITMMVTGFHHSVDRGTEGHVMNYGKVFDLKSIALKPSFHNTDLNPSSGISGLITSEQSVEISGNSSAMNLVEHLSPTNSQSLLKQPSNCQTFFGGSSGSCVSSSRRRESVCAKDKEVCTHASSNTGICKSGNGKRKGRKKSVTLHQPADEACFKITPSRVNQSFSSVKKSSSGESIPRQPTLDCPKSSLCQDNHGNESNALNFRKSCFDYRQHKENIGWAGERTDAKNKHDDKTKLSEVDRCRVNKRRHVAIVDPMEEETSSTTTESSCADVDSSEKNGNKNAKANKMKWPASESRTGTDSSKVDEADDEEEFEVFTRSRLRKLRDHHLYHQKENRVETSSASVNYANNHRNLRDVSKGRSHWQVIQAKSKPMKKPTAKCRTVKRTSNDTESSSTGKDSPPPEWDHPKCVANIDEAYNELASQTENFAIRVQKAKSNFSEKSSPSPAFSHGWKFKNREKNFWNTSGESSRLLPIGKVAPEPKKHDPKLLGPVGQKPLSQTTQLPSSMNSWNSSRQRQMTLNNQVLNPPHTTLENPSHYCLPHFLDNEQHSSNHLFNFPLSPSSPPPPPPVFSGFMPDPFSNAQFWNKSKGSGLMENECRSSVCNEENNWLNLGDTSSYNENVWDNYTSSSSIWQQSKDDQDHKVIGPWDGPLIKKPQTMTWPSLLPWTTTTTTTTTTEVTANPDTQFHFARPTTSNATCTTDEQLHPVAEYNPFSSLHSIWTPRTSSEIVNDNQLSTAWPRSEISSSDVFASPLKPHH